MLLCQDENSKIYKVALAYVSSGSSIEENL